MPEIAYEVKTFIVEMICPECLEGKMEGVGFVYTMSPPLHPHICPNCGHKETYRKQYPHQITERINNGE